ncbi:MAG: cysteine--tRNA ligase [Candidatus Dormibacteria bacterium]
MRLHNTLTHQVEELVTVEPGVVRMYSCGPTVYNFVHIGNLRTFVFGDFLRRVLRQQGRRVVGVMNITDVDDKTIRGAAAEGISLDEFTRRYERHFFEDAELLNIERPEHTPRATEHIEEMVGLVRRLGEAGVTYERDGSVYFRIAAFPAYGRLARLEDVDLRAGARVDSDEYGKEEARDFVLWKGAEPGSVGWETELGFGRPGWHLECSAMSMKYLGETFDLHTGAVDLIFPHHENEIAQSEAATGHPFVRHWVHPEHLQLSGDKMAKSTGNMFTLRDLTAQGFDPLALRLLFTTAHYRQRLNFTLDALRGSSASLQRLRDFSLRLTESEAKPGGEDLTAEINHTRAAWAEALADDLNLPVAMAALFDLVRTVNRALDLHGLDAASLDAARLMLAHADQVVAVLTPSAAPTGDAEVERLVALRDAARASRDFEESDRLRQQLQEMGVTVEDRPGGARWRRT